MQVIHRCVESLSERSSINVVVLCSLQSFMSVACSFRGIIEFFDKRTDVRFEQESGMLNFQDKPLSPMKWRCAVMLKNRRPKFSNALVNRKPGLVKHLFVLLSL